MEEAIEQMTEALERYQQAMEVLRPAFEAFKQAMLEWWREIRERLHVLVAALLDWWEEVRREELYRCLRRWRVPHGLARFLAQKWPERWLPWPENVG
jgi:hypothetical protein